MRVVMEPGWQETVLLSTDEVLDGPIKSGIVADAKRYCPVDTGALRESIDGSVTDHALTVHATGGADDRDYAAYVELGHRIAHGPGMKDVGPKTVPPRPFLRPALYQERGQ